jgi:hypothetical protein
VLRAAKRRRLLQKLGWCPPVARSAQRDRFKVEGLTCPAAPGYACAHRIQPVLERLRNLDGVECCAANRSGTMIRISVKAGIDRNKVAEAARQALSSESRKPILITGDALARALVEERWTTFAQDRGAATSGKKKNDPTRRIVFKVESLTCPAVTGLGCGHRLAPVLAALKQIDGVEQALANRAGTLLCIAFAPGADHQKVTAAAAKLLTKERFHPIPVPDADLQNVLDKEEWYLPGQLSAIEFRTLALGLVQSFAEGQAR